MRVYSPRLYFKDFWIWAPFTVSLFLLIYSWVIVLMLDATGEQILLHYTIIYGVDLVGSWWGLVFYPFIASLFLLVNYLLSLFLYTHERWISRLISVLTVFVMLFMAIAIYCIVGLNI